MPKQVDHHERRTLLADALLRVAAHRGLMDVSLRHVAAEAGVTAGMVQHYFRTKDEMMIFALDVISARVQARLTDEEDPRLLVRALLVQLLPLDADRVLEGRVAVAYHAYAATRPDVAARLRQDSAGMRAAVAGHIRAARAPGHPGPLDPEIAATGLLALLEGLAVHVLGGHLDPGDALATLDAHLDMAFGPRE